MSMNGNTNGRDLRELRLLKAPITVPSVGINPVAVPGMDQPPTLPTGTVPASLGSHDHRIDSSQTDWALVSNLRAAASERLAKSGTKLDPAARRQLGRSIIMELLEQHVRERVNAGQARPDQAWSNAHAQAVDHALFGLGRLQPLVDDARIENIEVNGCDRVRLHLDDGTRVLGPSVAESDEELLEFLQFVASRDESSPRPFSPSVPRLHLTLPGGARLAAAAWNTPRPYVVIRRHRLVKVTLDDLVARATMTPVLASLLRAVIRARLSVVVSGAMGAGKTTLVRALSDAIPAGERIGTFETEFELFLDQLPERGQDVLAWEGRPGSGERGLDGRSAGEITLEECLFDSFRFNLDRLIVGEVRGREILAMFKAMQSGSGSLSTTHAGSAVDAIDKLITCALEAGPQVTVDYAERVLARHIQFVVHLDAASTPDPHGGPARRQRFIREVIAVHPGEDGPAHTTIFAAAPHTTIAVPNVLPDEYRNLANYGFDLASFTAHGGRL